MNYSRQIAIVIAVSLAMLGAVQAADPVLLGISPVMARWFGIISAGLGVLAGFLPPVHRLSDTANTDDFDPAFVDAISDALLKKRAEQIAQSHPDGAPTPPPLITRSMHTRVGG